MEAEISRLHRRGRWASVPPQRSTGGVAVATRLAMIRAIEALSLPPDHLLIDWVRLPQLNIAQTSFSKADQRSVSVAAASILARCIGTA